MHKKFYNTNFLYTLLIITISGFISFFYYFEQYALLNSYYISQIIEYPNQNNPFYLSLVNSPSLIFYVVSTLLKIGIPHEIISRLILFSTTLFNVTGIFLICRYLTNSKSLSLLITFILIFFTKNFKDIDYPTLIFSEHTMGMISLSFCTLMFGLITLRNLSIAFFVNIIFILIHPVVGLWMFVIISLSILLNNFQKQIEINKQFYYFIVFTSILILYFFYVDYKNFPYDKSLTEYKLYFDYIEGHRTNYGDLKSLNWSYISKTFFLCFFILIYLFKINDNKQFFFQTVLLSIFFSFFLYFTYKNFPQIFPEILVKIIPQRFFLSHSVIGYAIIISIIYNLINIYFKNTNYNLAYYLISLILVVYFFKHNNEFIEKTNQIIKNEIYIKNEKQIWAEAENVFIPKGLGITSNDLCIKTTVYLKKPLLICFDALDYIPYFPELAKPSRQIVEGVLGIDYKEIPIKHFGKIFNSDLKEVFESKSKQDWLKIKNKFNVSFLIFPIDWKINLESYDIGNKYKVYIIN